jgi:hypothetical protein
VRRCLWMALALIPCAAPALAADMAGPPYGGSVYGGPVYGLPPVPDLPPAPRYFPRGDGSESEAPPAPPPRRVVVACTPRRVPVPTNAPDDPSYVGSPYGLGHPSYYGFTPPTGIDDPYGRSLLPYCR